MRSSDRLRVSETFLFISPSRKRDATRRLGAEELIILTEGRAPKAKSCLQHVLALPHELLKSKFVPSAIVKLYALQIAILFQQEACHQSLIPACIMTHKLIAFQTHVHEQTAAEPPSLCLLVQSINQVQKHATLAQHKCFLHLSMWSSVQFPGRAKMSSACLACQCLYIFRTHDNFRQERHLQSRIWWGEVSTFSSLQPL